MGTPETAVKNSAGNFDAVISGTQVNVQSSKNAFQVRISSAVAVFISPSFTLLPPSADKHRTSRSRSRARRGSGGPVHVCPARRRIDPAAHYAGTEPPHSTTENLGVSCARRSGRWSSLVLSHNRTKAHKRAISP